jgi:energy-coupling factor transporter ATP-binding protein EcfA2
MLAALLIMKRSIIPKISVLRDWVEALSITELPISYQVLCGLSAIGACLKRYVYVNQVNWRVYPNMSVLLVGPSGIGKDTAITAAEEVVSAVGTCPILGGKTMDGVKADMADMAPPAAAFIPAKELTAFLGGKDYQKSMVQELTDLLSTGNRIDVSTKTDRQRYIYEPTVTMQAGSTEDWLYKAMPEGALKGGFLPRFVIICEDRPARHVAWVAYDNDKETTRKALEAKARFTAFVANLVERFRCGRPSEMTPDEGALNFYRNWYANRFDYFSKLVEPYANRSRDHVHRIAMLCALSCGRGYLEERDYVFAAQVIGCVADGIDSTIAPMMASEARLKRPVGRPKKQT